MGPCSTSPPLHIPRPCHLGTTCSEDGVWPWPASREGGHRAVQQTPVKPVGAVGEAVGEPGGGGYRTVCSSGWSRKDAVGTELTVAVRLWGVGVFPLPTAGLLLGGLLATRWGGGGAGPGTAVLAALAVIVPVAVAVAVPVAVAVAVAVAAGVPLPGGQGARGMADIPRLPSMEPLLFAAKHDEKCATCHVGGPLCADKRGLCSLGSLPIDGLWAVGHAFHYDTHTTAPPPPPPRAATTPIRPKPLELELRTFWEGHPGVISHAANEARGSDMRTAPDAPGTQSRCSTATGPHHEHWGPKPGLVPHTATRS